MKYFNDIDSQLRLILGILWNCNLMTLRPKEKCTMTFIVALLQIFPLVHMRMICALAVCFVIIRKLHFVHDAISVGSIDFVWRMYMVRTGSIVQVCLQNFDVADGCHRDQDAYKT